MAEPGSQTDAAHIAIGVATPRTEGRMKVTGEARYGSDFDGGQSLAYAYLITSPIARGRIVSIDDADARAVPRRHPDPS